MSSSNRTVEDLREELIRRVAALDGKQATIDTNQKSLAATVEALAECTDVDLASIQSVADTLSVRPEFVHCGTNTANSANNEQLTRRIKFAAIAVVILFAISMFKWMNVNNNIDMVLHEISQLQSRIADFRLRTGRFPHEFSQVGYASALPQLDSAKTIEMGPYGQLLVNTSGVFGGKVLLSPVARSDGRSTWQCTTNASWLFKISSWLCEYASSVKFKNQ